MAKIDFDKTLASGLAAYNKSVGKWWIDRTRNAAHVAAYKNIAGHVVRCVQQQRGVLIDYGCGTGLILKRLVDALPAWDLLGIDGSQVLLREAEAWARRKRAIRSGAIEFRCAKLPDFSPGDTQADVILFTFPNIVSVPRERRPFEKLFPQDRDLARVLTKKQEKANRAVDLYDQLLMNRVVSRNLRTLLRKGGLCVRVDYSQANRRELCRFDQLSTMFEEGSLNTKQGHLRPKKFFKLLSSEYFPSAVILDVYEQTQDQDFLEGGYLISVLQAL
ncbi:MAG: class I SAM-dependent methyltransferase [Nitrospira sp.]|nr:class I SAM-dependent methyltransferase [Nitrospira sp.]